MKRVNSGMKISTKHFLGFTCKKRRTYFRGKIINRILITAKPRADAVTVGFQLDGAIP